MYNFTPARNLAILAFGAASASGAWGASYGALSVGSYSLVYGPLMTVSISGVPTATASRTGTGSAASSASGTYVPSPAIGLLLPQTTTGNWLAKATGASGSDGSAVSEATFDYTITLTNLAPGPNAYKLSFKYLDIARWSAFGPNQSAGVYSIVDATQTSLVAGNNSYSDVIYKSSFANGPGGNLRSRGLSSFSALMLPTQTDTLTIEVDAGGYANAVPMGAPEPPPLILGGLGLAAVARRRLKRK